MNEFEAGTLTGVDAGDAVFKVNQSGQYIDAVLFGFIFVVDAHHGDIFGVQFVVDVLQFGQDGFARLRICVVYSKIEFKLSYCLE